MINDAVKNLLEAYGKDEGIEEIKKKREIVNEKLKFFTDEKFKKWVEDIERLKPGEDSKPEEILQYNKLFTEFEIYKIQHETYRAMDEDLEQYDKLKKEMEKKIRKVKAFNKDVIRMQSVFENLKISW